MRSLLRLLLPLLVTGCRSETVAMAPSSAAAAEIAGMIPITVVLLGQSNAAGPNGPSPFTLASQQAQGASVMDNGVVLTEYPRLVGPEPWLIDELLGLGYAPTVVVRAVNGASLENMRSTQITSAISDLGAQATADVVMLWQGEADSTTEALARTYHDKLVGPWGESGQESLRDLMRDAWPFAPLLLVELRVRDYDYGMWHPVVRAAQHRAGTLPDVCLVPSYDAQLAPGDNQPHVTVAGLETIGRRLAHTALAVIGGERCP